MKHQFIVNVFFAVMIIALTYLNLVPGEETETNPINYELYRYRFNELETRLDSLQSQFKTTQNEIVKDSLFVVGASRTQRDSLRAILNPR